MTDKAEAPARPPRRDGKPRKGHKATHTEARYKLKMQFWDNVQRLALAHIEASPRGEANRIARALGITPSQVHRFTCPVCEHDQEPTFSVGFGLLMYLTSCNVSPIIDIEEKPRKVLNKTPSKTK